MVPSKKKSHVKFHLPQISDFPLPYSEQRPGADERAGAGQPHVRHQLHPEGVEAAHRGAQVQRGERARIAV